MCQVAQGPSLSGLGPASALGFPPSRVRFAAGFGAEEERVGHRPRGKEARGGAAVLIQARHGVTWYSVEVHSSQTPPVF